MKVIKAAALGAALVLSVGLFSACAGGTSVEEITADTDRDAIVSQQLSQEEWAAAFSGVLSNAPDLADNYSVEMNARASIPVLVHEVGGDKAVNMTVLITDELAGSFADRKAYLYTDRTLRSTALSEGETVDSNERMRAERYLVAQSGEEACYLRTREDSGQWGGWKKEAYRAEEAGEVSSGVGAFSAFDLAERYDCFVFDRDAAEYRATEEGLTALSADLHDWMESDLLALFEQTLSLSGGSLEIGLQESSVASVSLKFSGGKVCCMEYALEGQMLLRYTDAQGKETNYTVVLTSVSGELFCYDRGRTQIVVPAEAENI